MSRSEHHVPFLAERCHFHVEICVDISISGLAETAPVTLYLYCMGPRSRVPPPPTPSTLGNSRAYMRHLSRPHNFQRVNWTEIGKPISPSRPRRRHLQWPLSWHKILALYVTPTVSCTKSALAVLKRGLPVKPPPSQAHLTDDNDPGNYFPSTIYPRSFLHFPVRSCRTRATDQRTPNPRTRMVLVLVGIRRPSPH